MRYLAHREHLGEHLGDFHAGGTNEDGTTAIAHLLHLFDYCLVLLALGLIDTVIVVLTDYVTIGGHLYYVQLVDIPELASLGNGCTCHTGQLVVHAEIVLQGNGGIGLSGCLNLDMLLGLYRLVQAIAPSATFHDTTRLLVHNLDFAILNHVLVIQIEHCVSLEQLLKGVHALALDGIVGIYFVFLLKASLVVQSGVGLDLRHHASNIGQYEESIVVHLRSEPVITLVGEVHAILLLLHHEVQGLYGFGHTAVVILHVNLFGGKQTSLDTRFREVLDESLVLGKSLEAAEERKETVGGLLLVAFCGTFCYEFLCLSKILSGQAALYGNEALHQWLILLVHLVVALGHRT